jgi:SagB-type dehydrogenase family enzyme
LRSLSIGWRDYHESTKHSLESLRRSSHALDWANMPDPFRHYEGVPVLDLPADPPVPETAALDVLQGPGGATPAIDGATFLSQLLFYSASISASKLVPSTGYRYALRVNPSSGNLHPTEFHFLTRGLKDWPDGLYHYRPSSHMAEQRALGGSEIELGDGAAPVVFVLTSIAWREAWKYGDRAYRYCLLDIGHAWQSLALAARAMGCEARAIHAFPDGQIAQAGRLNDDEWPMLAIELHGNTIPVRKPDACETVWYGGEANQLSKETIAYPRIQAMHEATKLIYPGVPTQAAPSGRGEIQLPPSAPSSAGFGTVVRTRRSALDFVGGPPSISLAQLAAILPASCFDFIQLYLYVHRVEGLEPGVYRHWPDHAELELIKKGDQRVAAAGLSLGQFLAGNACVAFSMIGDLERAARAHGDRGYRYVHFEAGAIGQRLYLAAEALGLRATGIGAFYDDEVHRHLGITPEQGQVVYHFAIGYPVPDLRVSASYAEK